jgi:hypothetical protein
VMHKGHYASLMLASRPRPAFADEFKATFVEHCLWGEGSVAGRPRLKRPSGCQSNRLGSRPSQFRSPESSEGRSWL